VGWNIRKWLALGLLMAPVAASATIIVDARSETRFSGTFSAFRSGQVLETEPFPLSSPGNYCSVTELRFYSLNEASFRTDCENESGEPAIWIDPGPGPAILPEQSSTWMNSLGTTIFYRFWNVQDTGGDDGIFSGNFCFGLAANTCFEPPPQDVPEPATFALVGLGATALFMGRRRKLSA
jgi:hypothetical protein